MRMRDVLPVLKELGLTAVVGVRSSSTCPLLFHYGRSDMSVDYNGAVVAPDALRDVIHSNPELLEAVENHRLISYEDDRGDRQLHIALQLTRARPAAAALDAGPATARTSSAELRAPQRGLPQRRSSPLRTARCPPSRSTPHRTGPFATDSGKLKNEYVWQLPAGDLDQWDMDLSHVFPRR